MNYILIAIIVILLMALAFLLKKLYYNQIETLSKIPADNKSILKTTWN